MGCKVVCPSGAIDVEVDRASYRVVEFHRGAIKARKLDEYTK